MPIAPLSHLATSGDRLIDLGPQPVSNRFRAPDDIGEAPRFPFELRVRPDTGLLHLGAPFPITEVRPRFDWLTCFEPEDHLDALAERIVQLPGVDPRSVFGAYSFKDDTTLRRLEKLGYRHNWRIDPAVDLNVTDPCANVETYQAAFTPDAAARIVDRHGLADVLIVRHVVEHAYDLPTFIESTRRLVRPGGYIVWELPDCERALSAGDCTTLWEEHIFYFTAFTFRQLLLDGGFDIVHFESVPYPLENSVVAITRDATSRATIPMPDAASVATEIERANAFARGLAQRQAVIREKLTAWRRNGGPIALFGAGHLAVAFLSFMEIADLCTCVIDDNPHKKGMRMPLGDLPIVGSDTLYSSPPGLCLLCLNPHNQPAVIGRHNRYVEQGGKFASIFPGTALALETLL